jgi:hypothetical protein
MHAALLGMSIMGIVHLVMQSLAMLQVMHRTLVARSFSGPRTLDFGRVGDRHFWRLIATEYLCFFFRHGSPQQIVTSATCRQQRCLQ